MNHNTNGSSMKAIITILAHFVKEIENRLLNDNPFQFIQFLEESLMKTQFILWIKFCVNFTTRRSDEFYAQFPCSR